METTRSSSERNGSGGGGGARSVGKNGGSYYGDKVGTSWFMYGPSSKGDSGDDGRVEEGRSEDGDEEEEEGMQMQEWERRDRRDGGSGV